MISARSLTKFYDDTCAVRDVSFDIRAGEIVGILGLNGAGKTTILRILASLLLPSSGSVRIGDLDVVEHPHELRKLVGFLPETPPLYAEMTVEDYLLFAGQLRGSSATEARSRVAQVIDQTNLAEVRRQPIATLSHGFRQRVGIAQAVVHRPPVVILDEPIQGLDPVQIVEMRELVRGLAGQHTVLLSSHILTEIHQTCDRILVLHEGTIAAVGTEHELMSRLSGAYHLSVVVRGDQAQVLKLVRGLAEVTSAEVAGMSAAIGDTGELGSFAQLHVASRSDIRETLSRTLIQAGFGLLELRRARGDLESLFLELTHSTTSTGAHAALSAEALEASA